MLTFKHKTDKIEKGVLLCKRLIFERLCGKLFLRHKLHITTTKREHFW